MTPLSIIIVSWNNEDIIKECLDSLGMFHETAEVIVVDNKSSDRTVEIIESSYPNIKLIKNTENVGFAKANNQAIAQSSGKYLLLLNSDAFLMDKTVEILLSFMDNNNSVGIAGPQQLYPDGSLQRSFGSFPTVSRQLLSLIKLHGSSPRRYPDKTVHVDYMEGACMLIRRIIIDKVGLFDESFFFYGEDADFCYRAKKAGWGVCFVHEARVIHLRGGSSTKKEYFQYVVPLLISQYQFTKKHYYGLHHNTWKLVTIFVLRLRLGFNIFKHNLKLLNMNEQDKKNTENKIIALENSIRTLEEMTITI